MQVLASLNWLKRRTTGNLVDVPLLTGWATRPLQGYVGSTRETITTCPPEPFWWYTNLKDALVSLGAPRGVTHYAYNPAAREPNSTMIRVTSGFLEAAASSVGATIHPLYRMDSNTLVGCIAVHDGLVDVFLHPDVGLGDNYKLTLIAAPRCIGAALRTIREEEKHSLRTRVDLAKAAYEAAVADNESYNVASVTECNDPRAKTVNVVGTWIVVTTGPLVCRIGDSHQEKTYFLGESTILINIIEWKRVIVLPKQPRNVPHPHSGPSGVLCLGRDFSGEAVALQRKGYFGLYLTLLLEHLENGVDSDDAYGQRVFSLPRIGDDGKVIEDNKRDEEEEEEEDEDEDEEYDEEEFLESQRRTDPGAAMLDELFFSTPTQANGATPMAPPNNPAFDHWITRAPSPRAGFEFVLNGNVWEERLIT